MKTIAAFIALLCTQQCLGQGHGVQYEEVLHNLRATKAEYARALDRGDSIVYTSCSETLLRTLTDSVFRAWYGTPWDFNGISNEPGKGEIACGYFVSTTLKHAGFNLNRYKLAQQDATSIARAFNSKLIRFNSLEEMLKTLSSGHHLYVIGLDYHVGFLSIEAGKAYFIHSDYVHNKVLREEAASSLSLKGSEVFVLAEITDNPLLMSKWLKNERVY
jgi:hypothetical protein